MPTSYQIDVAEQLVRTRAWGELSDRHVRDHFHRLVADPRFRPDFRQLTNLDEVTNFTITHWMIAEAASWPVFDMGTRRAIVGESDIAFGLARMFSLNAERVGHCVRAFHRESDAQAWIDSPPDPVREPDVARPASTSRIIATVLHAPHAPLPAESATAS